MLRQRLEERRGDGEDFPGTPERPRLARGLFQQVDLCDGLVPLAQHDLPARTLAREIAGRVALRLVEIEPVHGSNSCSVVNLIRRPEGVG
jgi:hypothetical protein